MSEFARPSGTIVVRAARAASRSIPTWPISDSGWRLNARLVAAARAAAAEAMTAILAAVTDAGVAQRDVRTTVLSVQPRYDYRDGKAPTLTGDDLANVVDVTVRWSAGLSGPPWTGR